MGDHKADLVHVRRNHQLGRAVLLLDANQVAHRVHADVIDEGLQFAAYNGSQSFLAARYAGGLTQFFQQFHVNSHFVG